MPAWGQKVDGKEDPCCPCQQGNSISWPCQLLPLLLPSLVVLSLSASPRACKLVFLPGELGQLCLGSGMGFRRIWPLGQQQFLWAVAPACVSAQTPFAPDRFGVW